MSKNQSLFAEDKRLNALSEYQILDTLPERNFDAITRLTSQICKTPVALISFVDAERQWVKSSIGIDVKQVPRTDAFCNQTILESSILEVEDVLEDKNFSNSPFLINDPQIRFYAGAPLIDPDGYQLGTLCVMDMVRRKLTDEQLGALSTLADQVMSNLVLRKQKRLLADYQLKDKDHFNLFNSSSEIHCIMDTDFRIRMINNPVNTILGYTPDEAMGILSGIFSQRA